MCAVKYQNINMSAGEVVDGAVGVPGIFTTIQQNVFLNDQKHLIVRPANDFLKSFSVPEGKFIRAFESSSRGWLVLAHLTSDNSATIVIFNDTTSKSIVLNSTTKIESIFFYEVDSSSFTAMNDTTKINTVVGVTAIFIFGLDTVYLLDDGAIGTTPAAKKFKIKTSPAVAGVEVTGSVDATLYQSRFVIVATGPKLAAGSTLPALSPNRLLFSGLYSVDDFVIVVGTAQELIAESPFDAIIVCPADEKFYAISTDENLLTLVTSTGIRIIKSSNDMSNKVTSVDIMNYVGGYGSTIRARAFPFAGFLVYAVTYTLRAKMLASLETNYVNTIDLTLPLLSDLPGAIRDISMDYNNQNLLIYTEDGTISCIAPQSIIPSKSYNLSLPLTRSYVSEGCYYMWVSSLNPLIMLLRNESSSGHTHYTMVACDQTANSFGYLLDGAMNFAWDVKISNKDDYSFTATFEYPDGFANTTNVTGMWLLEGVDEWRFYATDSIDYPKFTTQVAGHTLINNNIYECILVVEKDAFEMLPCPFQQKYSVAMLNVNLIGKTDNNNYISHVFYNYPINDFNTASNLPVDQLYNGSIDMYVALSAPEMSVGWRDLACVDNLHNAGGVRCTLLSDSNDIGNYIEFYTKNSSVSPQIYKDSTEIEFQTDASASYAQKSINARSKTFAEAAGSKKLLFLIGQY